MIMRLAIIGAILAVLSLPSTLPHDRCESVGPSFIRSDSKSANSAALVVSLRSIMQCISSISRRVRKACSCPITLPSICLPSRHSDTAQKLFLCVAIFQPSNCSILICGASYIRSFDMNIFNKCSDQRAPRLGVFISLFNGLIFP
jgi:hypothetical protein